jgi:hypothetical protein
MIVTSVYYLPEWRGVGRLKRRFAAESTTNHVSSLTSHFSLPPSPLRNNQPAFNRDRDRFGAAHGI